MTRRQRQPSEGPGQDSFLDIVANLVGILIILVMVAGVRARDAFVAAAPLPPEPPEALAADVASVDAAVTDLTRNIHRIHELVDTESREIQYRRNERDALLRATMAAQKALEEQRGARDAASRQQYDLAGQVVAAQSELEDLKRRRAELEASRAPRNVIRHMPTPMAKTAFGEEIHFRLANGRLTFIPWDELVDRLKTEAPEKVWKLKDVDQITESIGPIDGFRMEYVVARVEESVQTQLGPAVQRRIELDHFVMIPIRDDLGETVDQALANGSRLQAVLAEKRPRQTTITIWVYPDSFGSFRRIREYLYQRGFLTGSRPLPAGHPIGGSPRGTSTVTQ